MTAVDMVIGVRRAPAPVRANATITDCMVAVPARVLWRDALLRLACSVSYIAARAVLAQPDVAVESDFRYDKLTIAAQLSMART